jgi:hypothetical protein
MQNVVSLAVFIVLLAVILYLWDRGRKGIKPWLRPPDGIKGLDEAVGRATEMGRPVFFFPGRAGGGQTSTTAAVSVLNYVVQQCAKQGTDLFVGVMPATTLPYVQEAVHTGCVAAGVPEAENNIRVEYLSDNLWAFIASYDGRMLREKAAANLIFGGMGADTLLYAETGARIGAFQVTGIQDTGNIHWPAAVCYYYMLPEELYVAGAILAQEPVEMQMMVAYDFLRILCLVLFLAVGLIVTHALGWTDWVSQIAQ